MTESNKVTEIEKLFLSGVLPELEEIFEKQMRRSAEVEVRYKDDGSPVTELDELLSCRLHRIYEKVLKPHGLSILCEERAEREIRYPLLAMDPLDGTRSFMSGSTEWCVCLSFLDSAAQGRGWIYHPYTKRVFQASSVCKRESFPKNTRRLLVSWSEWREVQKSTQKFDKDLCLYPVGSMAYKLALLSHGLGDIVMTLKPKSIWDIAGGSFLVRKAGMEAYYEGAPLVFDRVLYEKPIYWCHKDDKPRVENFIRELGYEL